jgi:ParB family chromosome partitioning protein
VANALRLLSLPDKVLTMLEDGRLSAGHARALLSLETKELIGSAADIVIRQALSVRQTELLVKKMMAPSEKKSNTANKSQSM